MIPIQGILRWTHLLDLGGTMYLHALLGLITRDQFHRNLYEKFRATQPSPSAPAAADWSSIFRKWVDVASSESDDGESGDLNTNDNSLGFLSQSRAIIAVGGFGLLTFSPIREKKKKKEGGREREGKTFLMRGGASAGNSPITSLATFLAWLWLLSYFF